MTINTTDEALEKLLDHTFTPSDIGEEMLVRSYLADLLLTLMQQGESFSGKRPFGNSGWEENLVAPMIQCGVIPGTVSDDEWAEASGWAEADFEAAREALIGYVFGVEFGRRRMTDSYTSSDGRKRLISEMNYSHLKAAHAKAVRGEERMHEDAVNQGREYSNPGREAEIEAMGADLARRDAEYAAQQAEADGAAS